MTPSLNSGPDPAAAASAQVSQTLPSLGSSDPRLQLINLEKKRKGT